MNLNGPVPTVATGTEPWNRDETWVRERNTYSEALYRAIEDYELRMDNNRELSNQRRDTMYYLEDKFIRAKSDRQKTQAVFDGKQARGWFKDVDNEIYDQQRDIILLRHGISEDVSRHTYLLPNVAPNLDRLLRVRPWPPTEPSAGGAIRNVPRGREFFDFMPTPPSPTY